MPTDPRRSRRDAASRTGSGPPAAAGSAGGAGAAFDPDAAATGDGLFGLPASAAQPGVVVIPVPFDATTSYRPGTAAGPAAILEASRQVDLEDLQYGPIWKAGIEMRPIPAAIAALSRRARKAAEPIIRAGGVQPGNESHRRGLQTVNDAGAAVNLHVRGEARKALDAGALPVLLGGDHSTPFGLIQETAARNPGVGILQVDAHADLRERFEGFDWSHASIFHNVMTRTPGVARLVQVGVRDFGAGEKAFIDGSRGRVRCWFDQEIRERQYRGGPRGTWNAICRDVVRTLPARVHVSFDIDGLAPQLCPDTGTPVPGGLAFAEVCHLLHVLARSGKRVVSVDLCEVAPDRGGGDWNANVGARVLYKLIGCAMATRR